MDGQFQTFAANDGAFNRAHFFNQNPELAALVADWTDDAIDRLHRGGHDMVKIHAAYHRAARHRGQPTVILAQTKKGFGMGTAGQGKMTTHQQKKLDDEALLAFRDRFALPISDADCLALKFYRPAPDSAEIRHLQARRAALGGHIPRRNTQSPRLPAPEVAQWGRFALEADGKEMSSTMAIVRMLTALLKDATVGPRIVPIVADEARTFGMANLFRQIGIYSAQGQLYEPEDIGSVLYYREARDGQILEEGITEAGAISSWTAAGTSYSVNGLPMLPFYIYYSMFGFQRIGDLIWAAADQRTRGFLVGATSGRTTLGGEGLQHQDGSSHLTAATVPNCRAYDPAYAYEVAVIVEYGMRRMLDEQHDEFFYLTVTNENLAQPDMPADPAARAGILRGLYRLRPARQAQARLLGSGPMLREAELAADRLRDEYGVDAEVWSVTSYSELARDGREAERACLLACRRPRMPTGSGPAWATARPRDRRQRLRARRARTDPRLGARALPHAGHRRFRPQRHAGATARLLRGRPRLDRAASAGQPGTRGRRPGAARAAGRGNAPDAALGAVKHGRRPRHCGMAASPPPIPHRPVPGSRSAVGLVPGRHSRLSSSPFLSRPARSPNRADFPPRSRAGLIKVHPESAARCGAASARARFLVKYGRSQAFPQNTRAPGPHFVSRFRFTVDGPRRPYPHGRHSR